jgi:uncharacterized protein with HEPN domain
LSKEPGIFLKHIEECIVKIERYTAAGREAFMADDMTRDAVVRNFEIIGEAAKQFDVKILELAPDVNWRGIKGFRDILIHAYSDVDFGYVWTVVELDLPGLKAAVLELLKSYPPSEE